MKVISFGQTRHECKLPGFWKRYRLGLKYRAIIQCDCGKKYQLDLWENEKFWNPLYNHADGVIR